MTADAGVPTTPMSTRVPLALRRALKGRAAARSCSTSDLLRLAATWAVQASDDDLDRYLPAEPGHQLTLTVDEQRKRGWYLAWKCERRDCDAAGNLTVPTRDKAIELFRVVADAHPKLVEEDRA